MASMLVENRIWRSPRYLQCWLDRDQRVNRKENDALTRRENDAPTRNETDSLTRNKTDASTEACREQCVGWS